MKRTSTIRMTLITCLVAWGAMCCAAAGTTSSREIAVSDVPVVDVQASASASSGTAEIRDPALMRGQGPNAHIPSLRDPATTPPTRQLMPDLCTSETVVLAAYKGHSLTNQELSATLAMRKPRFAERFSVEQILKDRELLRRTVREMVYEQLLLEKARAAGVDEQTSEIKARIDEYRQNTLDRLFYQREVDQKLSGMDEQTARQYYEENKAKLYTSPARTKVEEIYLSGYQAYDVKQGDTLEGIARKECGSAAAAGRILRNDGVRYPRRPVHHEQAPFEEVKPGEKLLVPLAGDEITSRLELARSLRRQIDEGADFAQLAAKHCLLPDPYKAAFVADLDAIHPDLRRAIEKTPAGKVTDAVASPHGIHLFRVVDRQSTRTMPFDEVRKQIELTDEEKKKNIEQVKRDIFDKLRARFGVELNMKVLERANPAGADPLTADTPIVTATDFVYTLEQFQRDMAPTMKSWTGMSLEERVNLAKAAPAVVRYIARRGAKELELDKTDAFAGEMKSKAIIEVTGEYMRRRIRELSAPTDEQLRDYYNTHIDRYTSPSLVMVREITRRVDMGQLPDKKNAAISAAREELSRLRGQIKTQQDFEQAARRESHALSTRSRGGLIGSVPTDFRGPVVRNQLEQLKPGEVSEPFLYGSEVMILRLDAVNPPVVTPFEEAYKRVRIDFLRDVPGKLLEREKETLLKEAGFEMKI